MPTTQPARGRSAAISVALAGCIAGCVVATLGVVILGEPVVVAVVAQAPRTIRAYGNVRVRRGDRESLPHGDVDVVAVLRNTRDGTTIQCVYTIPRFNCPNVPLDTPMALSIRVSNGVGEANYQGATYRWGERDCGCMGTFVYVYGNPPSIQARTSDCDC